MTHPQAVNPLTAPPQRKGGRQRTTLTPEQLDALLMLDVVEAAALLRVGTDLIRREIREGRLIAENYGTPARPLYRIPRPQLDAWRAERRAAQAVK
ncbi:helix-turn-helix domain-containing protein [Deinococcus sp. NW-56]|uniref:helix-turn-helix domain-containing protein n=1 Tax=Deinococcus sp. NW-56 TaxID=2080419 RepID=UPI0018F8A22A|nr:helix-turn-helix domain-containing protein [Deinococcus sp. NW-56]